MGRSLSNVIDGNKVHSQITIHADHGEGFISMVNNVNDQGESYRLFGLQDGLITPLGLPRGVRNALKESNDITSNV